LALQINLPQSQGQIAVLVVDGTVTCQQASGGLYQQRLKSHDMSSNAHVADAVERQKGCMLQALALNRFPLAFKIGLALNATWTGEFKGFADGDFGHPK
jgi:hypothetical protein